jgi:hypothetical protein
LIFILIVEGKGGLVVRIRRELAMGQVNSECLKIINSLGLKGRKVTFEDNDIGNH